MDVIAWRGLGGLEHSAASSNGGRVLALDAMRGIAAFVVLIHHCTMTFGWRGYLDHFGIGVLVAGGGAVLFFFVLSGFVLTGTYLEKDRAYAPYAIKRLVRIYLPFGFAVLVAAAASALIGHSAIPGASSWFNRSGWHSPVTAQLLAGHLIFGTSTELDNAIWSLFHELRISLVLPFLALALRANRWPTFGVLAVALVSASEIERQFAVPALGESLLNSSMLLMAFAAGGVLALPDRPFSRDLPKGKVITFALIVGSLLVLQHAPNCEQPIASMSLLLKLVAGILAAWVLLVFGLGQNWMSTVLLQHPVATYLGKISFSLYLVHLIVLQVAVRGLHGIAPPWVAVLSVPIVSIPLAHLMQIYIEQGSQKLGRRLAVKATGRPRVAVDGLPIQSPSEADHDQLAPPSLAIQK